MLNIREKMVVLSVEQITEDGLRVGETISYSSAADPTGASDSFDIRESPLFGTYKVGQTFYFATKSEVFARKVEAEPGTPGFDNKVAAGEVEATGSGTKEQNANANVKAAGATPGEANKAITADRLAADRLAASDLAARRSPLFQQFGESDADFAARQRA